MAFALTSPAFENGQPIPEEYARDGGNRSPQLDWTDPPEGTESFVLVVEDADARPEAFRHWVVFNIPRSRRQLAAGRGSETGAEWFPQAINDFGNAHYDGPESPKGERPHTYRFRLAALNIRELGMEDRSQAADVWEAARRHILAEAELTGTYAPAG